MSQVLSKGEKNRVCGSATNAWVNRLLKLPETEHRRPKHWDNIDDPMVPSERSLYSFPFKEDWKKSCCKKNGKKCATVHVMVFIDN